MADKGWIKVHRSVQHCFLWNDKPYAKGQAWIDLLMLANYENKKGESQGRIVTYKRGVVHVPISELAIRWGWDRKKVSRFLKLLESDQMVSTNSTTHGTTITIVNYDNFQGDGTTNDQQKDNHSPTDDQPLPITKKDKKEKEIKNIKHKYGEYQHVMLTDDEYQKLGTDYGEWARDDAIQFLDEYIEEKGYKSKSHNLALRRWVFDAVGKKKPKSSIDDWVNGDD